jgi:hypothetical protein
MAGWLLAPLWGAERTLYAGAAVNAGVAILLLLMNGQSFARTAGALATAALAGAAFVFPQWDLAALTAGAYKYAAYYSGGRRRSCTGATWPSCAKERPAP